MKVTLIDREAIQYLVQELENFEKDKAIRAGLSAASRVLLQYGKQTLRARMKRRQGVTGNLIRSFTARVKRNKLGALAGFKWMDGNHAHLVDMGTVHRYRSRKNGGSTGVMPGNRFWTDTKATKGRETIDRLYRGVESAVTRINERRR